LTGETALDAQEAHEQIEEAGQEKNKRVAILIAALAALLAITETSGKNAEHTSLVANIEASDTWAFYQAKTVRRTVVQAAADEIEALVAAADIPPERAAAAQGRVAFWRDEARRFDSDDKTNEGRDALAAHAQQAEARRDHALAAYHNFEFGSAALQLSIVLASAAVITGVALLLAAAVTLGGIGTALCILGWTAPTLLPLL
jgi:hypothetical protein